MAIKSDADIAAAIKGLREKRAEREKIIKDMKAMEEKLVGILLTNMAAKGMKTVNFDGIGCISSSVVDHVEVHDHDKFSAFVFKKMQEAVREGRSAMNGLDLMAKGAKKSAVMELIDSGVTPEELGVTIVEKTNFKFTAAK